MKLLFSEYLNQSRLKLSIKFPEQTLIIIIDMMFEKRIKELNGKFFVLKDELIATYKLI